MKETLTNKIEGTPVTLRITTLWAFSEAFLGGILHGLSFPFAGLFLALVASVCITIIAAGTSKKGEIVKATLLVIAVKFILSPHTPPMAYIAVLIQGLTGEFLFLNRRMIKPAAFILTLFSLMYSAFQHLLILTIIFGKDIWTALDLFLNRITKDFIGDSQPYSVYIVFIYLGCYFLAGIAGGILNMQILKKVDTSQNIDLLLKALNDESISRNDIFLVKKGKRKKNFLLFGGILVSLLLLITYLPFFNSVVAINKTAELILRAVIIITAWNYFFTPLLQSGVQKWVEKYKIKKHGSVRQIVSLLPEVRRILNISWRLSDHPRKIIHVKNFITNSVLLIVRYE